MKIKNIGILCMFLVIATGIQPICAANYNPTEIHISDHDGNYLKQYNLNKYGNVEQFKATLYELDSSEGNSLVMRYLDFYVYKLTTDGSDPVEYYHTQKMTNLYGTATTPYIVFKPGDYTLHVSYGGNTRSKLNPGNASVKIHVA